MKTHRSAKTAILVIGSTTLLSAATAAQERTAQVTVQQQTPPPAQPAPAVVQTAPPAPSHAERETVSEKGGPSTGPLVSGIVVFGVSYGAAAIAAGASDNDEDRRELFVPFAGPWMALNNDHDSTAKVLLVTDGVFQALGGLLVINAFLNPQERTVTKTRAAQVQVAPAVTHSFLGLAATGRF